MPTDSPADAPPPHRRGSATVSEPPAASPSPSPNLHVPPDVSLPFTRGSAPSAFGTLLEPVLRAACHNRLSRVHWFRADWQRGGALTGYADYAHDHGPPRPAVVKLPVPPCERHWLVHLQPFDHVAPHIYAHGETLGGYDFAWVVMERLTHGPLGASWRGREFDLLVEAVGRFYAAAHGVPRTDPPPREDWPALLARARARAAAGSLPDAHRWSAALKRAARKLKRWTAAWESRAVDGWCHGDLHLGNAMTRDPAPHGPALLFDFAKTRADHWLHDAIYLESQFWARPHRLGDRRLCRHIAQQRKRHGLPLERDWPHLADARRALVAMTLPISLHRDGDPDHVRAALAILERAIR